MADVMVPFNVQKQRFVIQSRILSSIRDSLLAELAIDNRRGNGSYDMIHLNRSSELFQCVVDFLKEGLLPRADVRADLLEEAEYYRVYSLVRALKRAKGHQTADDVKEWLLKLLPSYSEVKEKLEELAVKKAKQELRVEGIDILLEIGYDTSSGPSQLYLGILERTSRVCAYQFLCGSGLSDYVTQPDAIGNFLHSISKFIVRELAEGGFSASFEDEPSTPFQLQNGMPCSCFASVCFKFTFLQISQ